MSDRVVNRDCLFVVVVVFSCEGTILFSGNTSPECVHFSHDQVLQYSQGEKWILNHYCKNMPMNFKFFFYIFLSLLQNEF